ncbi:hypothetical protein KAM398_19840 [Acinetobacter sp. KAM398]|nr:hypothetical protein KAM392_19840 [Acinetobacter sp. KAM392]GJC34878.1 hypothetical protein KAM393_20470 [Acinetobacter sp. KAM393]GJC37635.1 hypothetical protein KAM394_19750 [Acinetobacter sp. KAM394]GJC40526.1 hypothetical protein KAM395_20470 [Acinetobacter sp. KAM395]GJC43324.1 hypothetical protein KAM396_20210 [Acinetobacter sp. KAM396]GJC46216.1 hypothetical protein KAM397_20960 [Acinetobacter sp. KAM397]GJC48932.1 hypothetical protein KAM398_19840 [Acinetobacter sp. KAM398]GJC5176
MISENKKTQRRHVNILSDQLQNFMSQRNLDQAIASTRNASVQIQEINEPKKSYGLRIGS